MSDQTPLAEPRANKGGRPRKIRPADTEAGRTLAEKIAEAEAHSLAVGDAWRAAPTMANKTELLASELRIATLQRAWCALAGDQTHALRWAEVAAKLSREHAAAAESLAIDEAAALAARTKQERAVARRMGRG